VHAPLDGDAKGKGTTGSNREAESTDAPERTLAGSRLPQCSGLIRDVL